MKPRLNNLKCMSMALAAIGVLIALCLTSTAYAEHSNINVQCPEPTAEHPNIRCGHVVAGDGFVTMADDAQTPLYVFGFATLDGEPGGPAWDDPSFPAWVMDKGMLRANAPAPTISADEDDELFLTLTNVGMMMRPDLFDPHTVHFHGFPQAAPVFDGVPDSSISINMGASLSYYYNIKDPGTYMYHCHVEATEHMQMGMLGNLYIRPKQNKTGAGDGVPLAKLGGSVDPDAPLGYAYNDGDGTTAYDVEYPIQIGSFDPDFHNASFSVQPLPFADMKDKFFLLNGRGYPDTVKSEIISWGGDVEVEPGVFEHIQVDSQPVSSLITATAGDKILLRISNLSVTEFYTLATNGIPMRVVGLDARELVDGDGIHKLHYTTNSVTLGGGQSADVILDTMGQGGKTFFLYSTNLDKLSNNTENFGGMMTEIRIAN